MYLMFFLLWIVISWADQCHHHGIVIDGTIGSKEMTALQGPEYHISAEHGEIKGNNLFHSFKTFNVHKNEIATFDGPEHIEHIVSRVTGNTHSWIDGGIRSMMPNADIFFFNPNGVMFGPNVILDVEGSFHVSTCDYIGFTDQSRYEISTPSPLLTSSSPVSFGFVDNDFAQIHIQGKGKTIPSEYELLPSLYVKGDHTLSLISENIELIDGTVDSIQDFPVGTIVSNNGRINIASVASTGEVIIKPDGLDVSSFEKLGDITLKDQSVISASSGQVYIYGDHLNMNTSYINAGQYSSNGSTVEGFAGGSIDIHVTNLSLMNASGITIETFGSENSGDIRIHAEEILLEGFYDDDSSYISTNSISLDLINGFERKKEYGTSITSEQKYGNAGNINIYTGNLFLFDGSIIEASAFSGGNGGTIQIDASDTIDIYGNLFDKSGIIAMSISDNVNGGHAGDIYIQAKNLIIQNGGIIKNSTGGTADAGIIDIHVDENLLIKGIDQELDIDNPEHEVLTGILSITQPALPDFQETSGDAGNINISGKSFRMEQHANLNVSSNSSGSAGLINLDFETIELDNYTGIFSISLLDGHSGNIFLKAGQHVSLNHFSMIGAQSLGTGKPGGIIIDTPKITIDNHSTVSATSRHQDNTRDGLGIIIGRDIVLYEEEENFDIHQISDLICIQNHSEISTESHGKGQAGSIFLVGETIELDEHALVSSSSMKKGDSGHSGTITLISEKTTLDNNSILTTENAGMGDAGIINMFTSDLSLNHSSRIHSVNTYGEGGGASGMILVCKGIDGFHESNKPTIHSGNKICINNQSGLSTSSLSEGGAGAIIIRTKDLVMSKASFISAENKYHGFSEDIGFISIRGENLLLSSSSKISTQSESEADAGGIVLEMNRLSLSGKSYISSAGIDKDRKGAGGHIFIAKKITHIDDFLFGLIDIEDKLDLLDIFEIQEPVNSIKLHDSAYISTSSAGTGDAGGIRIGSQQIILSSNSRISSESTSTTGGGSAGAIKLENLKRLNLAQNSTITTQAVNTSVPDTIIPGLIDQDRLNGMISISASGNIDLFKGSISSSVLGGLGNGGNISILSTDTILNKSQIIANAYEGNGGNIFIEADYLIQSSDSIISASSQLGIDGNIVIEAFTENFDKQIISLAENFLDGSKWIQTPCQLRDNENDSLFFIHLNQVQPKSFIDWLPARYE